MAALSPVNRSQVFLTGHSMGGVGTWNIGFRHPAFRRPGALSPAAARSLALTRSDAGQAGLFAAGSNDQIVTPAKTAEWANIAATPGHFEYREYPGTITGIGLTSMPDVFGSSNRCSRRHDAFPFVAHRLRRSRNRATACRRAGRIQARMCRHPSKGETKLRWSCRQELIVKA